MRSLPILWLLLFFLLPPCVRCAQTPATADASDQKSATVAEKVLRLDTGEALKKAGVTLEGRGDLEFSVFAVTDEQGQFVFESVPPGSYDLQVSRKGYVDTEYRQKKPGLLVPFLRWLPGSGSPILQLAFQAGKASSNPVPGAINLIFTDYAQAGDRMRLTVDTAARKITSLSVNTYMGQAKDVVTLQIQMASLPDGTNYVRRTILNATAKKLVVTTTNASCQKL